MQIIGKNFLEEFKNSIEYHDQDLTDVYVVFTYNKAWEQKSSIDIPSVEMIITMTTSQNANFTYRNNKSSNI
ncbi:hypothetical protein RMAECT_0817 [Rickettsia rhipicephali str. Ect]|nr:hypothetical protein RMAECT_0817 [Rickettsia rhipicephali str. Ect]